MHIIPRWYIRLEFQLSETPEEYRIHANNFREVTDWINKLSFGLKVIKDVTIRIDES